MQDNVAVGDVLMNASADARWQEGNQLKLVATGAVFLHLLSIWEGWSLSGGLSLCLCRSLSLSLSVSVSLFWSVSSCPSNKHKQQPPNAEWRQTFTPPRPKGKVFVSFFWHKQSSLLVAHINTPRLSLSLSQHFQATSTCQKRKIPSSVVLSRSSLNVEVKPVYEGGWLDIEEWGGPRQQGTQL